MGEAGRRKDKADSSRPFWLSPRQVVVIPVAAPFKAYAAEVAQKMKDAGIFAEVDVSDNTLNKKIRNAQVAQWNFVMGEWMFSLAVDVERTRGHGGAEG